MCWKVRAVGFLYLVVPGSFRFGSFSNVLAVFGRLVRTIDIQTNWHIEWCVQGDGGPNGGVATQANCNWDWPGCSIDSVCKHQEPKEWPPRNHKQSPKKQTWPVCAIKFLCAEVRWNLHVCVRWVLVRMIHIMNDIVLSIAPIYYCNPYVYFVYQLVK